MNKKLFKNWIGLVVACLNVSSVFAGEVDYTDERVYIDNLPSGFVPAPKDLGDGRWAYVFDKPASDMIITVRKNLVIDRALVVGGGGAGGSGGGGGGGGGGVWTNDAPIDAVCGATVSVSVGAGGAVLGNGGDSRNENGGASVLTIGANTRQALGGGAGASYNVRTGSNGANGGGGMTSVGVGGQPTDATGHAGGQGCALWGVSSYDWIGGGGGGAGAPGQDGNPGVSPNKGKSGDGGEGIVSDITGTSVVYGSGGGAGNGSDAWVDSGVGGTNAGNGGGKDGVGSDGTSGTPGMGGGGGGASAGYSGGAGGCGTVVLVFSDPPDPALPAAHVSAETSGDYSHAVEVTVDKLGEGASSATVSLAYGLAGGSLGPYRTVKENVTAGEVVPCPMTNLPAGSYRYAVKIANNLGKEKVVEGQFRVVDLPPEDATGERIGLKGDLMTINLEPNEKGKFIVTYYNDVDIGAFNCDVYKRSKMVFRKVPANEAGYPCRPIYITAPKTDLQATDVSSVSNAYWIGIFEVTKEQYARVKGNPWESIAKPMTAENLSNYNKVRSNFDSCTYPATNPYSIEYRHLWDDNHNIIDFYSNPTNPVAPDSFFGKLNAKCVDGKGTPVVGFDLPTERQWEIAARAGSFKIWGSFWDGTKLVDGNTANFNEFSTCSLGAYNLQNVGTRKPNAWGLYDTLGMLWEMCLDVWNNDPSDSVDVARSEPEIPPEPASYAFNHHEITVYGGERVIRGVLAGYSFSDVTPSSRSHWRAIDGTPFYAPPDTDGFVGFRASCAFERQPPPPREDVKLWITDHADAGDGYVYRLFVHDCGYSFAA